MVINEQKVYTFDNVTLVPQYSGIKSRLDVNLKTWLTDHIEIDHPIVPTNMATITEFNMIKVLYESGGAAFLHRFMTYDNINNIIHHSRLAKITPICISVGVKEEDYHYINYLIEHTEFIPDVVLIDIAHGDSASVVQMIKHIKKSELKVDIIAGNVATGEGYERLVEYGVNGVRVGVAGGSVCETKIVTGHSLPTLHSVYNCYQAKIRNNYKATIIADGGIRYSGDIVKALAFGADTVCCGKMFAGSSATPGEIIEGKYKKYYGMSSEEAQNTHKNGIKKGVAPEGKSILVDYSGDTELILERLIGGVKSGLTYSGAKNITEFRQKVQICVL